MDFYNKLKKILEKYVSSIYLKRAVLKGETWKDIL